MKPKVSVVIPAYNHERFIGAAIESVLGQSHEDLELIIIDDGSTDRTASVIQSYKDSRMTYLYQENQDAYNTINRGLNLAQGEFIAILNSDDVYTTDRLEILLDRQKHSGAQCLFTDVIPISDDGEEFNDPDFGWNCWHKKNREFYFTCGDLYTAFLKGNFMVTTSNLFLTREAVNRTGKFCSLRYLHDYDYIFRVMLACPDQVEYMYDRKLLFYRIHSGNTLGEAAILGREQDKKVIRSYLLAAVPEKFQVIVGAGADRLVELEQELFEVKTAMAADPGVKTRIKQLIAAVRIKMAKLLG
jgi:glycosyltransferase involved in cell wall biosynthesis